MGAKLRLVSSNPHPTSCRRLDGMALHRLADSLSAQVDAGNCRLAHTIASQENLSPMDVAVVAAWMTKAGLSEEQILAVMIHPDFQCGGEC